MITEQIEIDRIKEFANNPNKQGYCEVWHEGLKDMVDTIETYQKAFEDIKEELYKERTNISFNLSEEKAKWTNSGIYDGLVWAEEIIDKHNPDKMRKEREDKE